MKLLQPTRVNDVGNIYLGKSTESGNRFEKMLSKNKFGWVRQIVFDDNESGRVCDLHDSPNDHSFFFLSTL